MRRFDLTPLFRSSIGFDRLSQLMDSALQMEEAGSSYPPYNIEKLNEQTYRLVMAIAGFTEDDITITLHENTLIITGKARKEEDPVEYLYRGIAGRTFERHFQIADFMKVSHADLDHGILKITLTREIPEAMKPREIKIRTKNSPLSPGKILENG